MGASALCLVGTFVAAVWLSRLRAKGEFTGIEEGCRKIPLNQLRTI